MVVRLLCKLYPSVFRKEKSCHAVTSFLIRFRRGFDCVVRLLLKLTNRQ